MAQFARPDADVTVDSWTSTPLWQKVDESVADDADFITSPAAVSTAELGLTTITDPVSSAGHILRVRYQRTSGSGSLNVEFQLYQATTQIATTGTLLAGAAWVTEVYTLSAAEADAITDYADLRVRLLDTHSSRQCDVSWVEFEVPAVAGGDPEAALIGGKLIRGGLTMGRHLVG